MKTTAFNILLIFLLLVNPLHSYEQKNANLTDTTIQNNPQENKAIDAVINSPTPPKEDALKQVNELTKYGFKDLFKNYSYNPSIPYSTQVNPNAETYMQDYLQAHGRYLQQMKATSVPYFNLIDRILVQYGLPKELKYLAVIESDLKSDALSSKGALGPWQLMNYTAKEYGLEVDQFADDRTDYTKSTNAAAKYLLSLYKNFNDWLLVIAAYNGGPGRVFSAIKKSGSKNFWNLQYYLPEESRNHVKKFIATHYIMETESTRNNFNYTTMDGGSVIMKPNITSDEAAKSDSVQVSGRFISSVIAKNVDMNITDFNRYNPGFDNTLASGSDYFLRLPDDKMKIFSEKKYPILNECVNQFLNEATVPAKDSIKKSK